MRSIFYCIILLLDIFSGKIVSKSYSVDKTIVSDSIHFDLRSMEEAPGGVVSVRKCCLPNEKVILVEDKVQCVDSVETFVPKFYNTPEEKLELQNFSVIFNSVGLPNCSYTVLDNGLDTWFNVLKDGTPVVGLNFWTIPIWLTPDQKGYCLDTLNVTEKFNDTNSVLIFCKLQDFDLYITVRILFGVLFFTSALSILITIGIYLLIWDHSKHGWTQFFFFLSLFFFYFMEGSRIFAKYNGLKITPSTGCFVHAVLAQYFIVVLSGTNCVMGLDIFLTFLKLKSVPSKAKKMVIIYQLIAWVVPLLTIVVGLYLHFYYNPETTGREISGVFQYAHYRCSSPIWEFAFRVQILMMFFNLLSFIGAASLILIHIRSTAMAKTNLTERRRWIQFKRTSGLFLRLFFMTGVTWILNAVDLFYGHENPLGWGFIMIRAYLALQGVVYLILFGLHRKNFVKLGRKYPKLKESRFAWLFKSKSKPHGSSSGSASNSRSIQPITSRSTSGQL